MYMSVISLSLISEEEQQYFIASEGKLLSCFTLVTLSSVVALTIFPLDIRQAEE